MGGTTEQVRGRIAHTYGGVERDTPASIGGLPHEGHQRALGMPT